MEVRLWAPRRGLSISEPESGLVKATKGRNERSDRNRATSIDDLKEGGNYKMDVELDPKNIKHTTWRVLRVKSNEE